MLRADVDHRNPKVAVIGCGYWGKNLVRNFYDLGALACVCDLQEVSLCEIQERYSVRTTSDFHSLLDDPEIPAMVIAAPAAQHYELAKQALFHGKDVFVEKPLALRSSEGAALIKLARERNLILMVGHILEYHPAIAKLKGLVRDGELGRIQYIYSSRLNLGKLRTEESILWSFAPHDVSAILALLDEIPIRAASSGGYYLSPNICDTTLSSLEFATGVKAHIFVSWLHPFKEQKLSVIGDRKMAVFDDMEPDNKLVLYSHRIDWVDRVPVARRDGAEVVPTPKEEPLRIECEHFLQCVRERRPPRTSGDSALRVLRVLEACEQSLCEKGRPVEVPEERRKFFAHSTAVVDEPCEIDEGTKVWHFSHIMAGATIGKYCNLGQNVHVASGVRIGNNVKIQNNVSVYKGVEIEDDVFCGPSMVFTNVINPRSHVARKNEFKNTLVRRGATIGANATIVCGTTIGCYAFVGAGAVVTRDVPDYALVVGIPARRVGWMCVCGVPLEDVACKVKCHACGCCYKLEGNDCLELVTQSFAEVPTPIQMSSTEY